jgi:hypothetical protein
VRRAGPGHPATGAAVLLIDATTGVPTLTPHQVEGQRPSARKLEQEIKARLPERLGGFWLALVGIFLAAAAAASEEA